MINPNLTIVKAHVKDAYSYVRTGNPKITEAVGNYLKTGKDIPMATLLYKVDEVVAMRKRFHEMDSQHLFRNDDEFNSTWSRMLNKISTEEAVDQNFDAEFDFYKSLANLYPKTLKRRIKSLLSNMTAKIKEVDRNIR